MIKIMENGTANQFRVTGLLEQNVCLILHVVEYCPFQNERTVCVCVCSSHSPKCLVK